ncbi:MAG: hypothetical protein O7D91_08115 [Planctomycetota bacterium]|nr:hypothetical protein [Planctomycetota bacterium]
MLRIPSLALCITLVQALSAVVPAHAQPGWVLSHQKISDTEGGFTGILDNSDWLGWSVASLGDLDGDGVGDLAVGAIFDDDGAGNRGAVWVLFLEQDGTVKSHQKISDTEGGFDGDLDNNDRFGASMASLGDLDGDDAADLAQLLGSWGPCDGCPADLDGNGTVGAPDLAQLLGNWGPCEGCPADFNGDGVVNAFDLAQVLGAWGLCR